VSLSERNDRAQAFGIPGREFNPDLIFLTDLYGCGRMFGLRTVGRALRRTGELLLVSAAAHL
jgi:hypothetical protein